MKTSKFLLILMIYFSSFATTFTLEDALSSALKKNEDILIANEELAKSKLVYDEAYSGALPKITAKVTVLRKLYSSQVSNMAYGMTALGNQLASINNALVENNQIIDYDMPTIPLSKMPAENIDALKDNTIKWEVNLMQPIWLGGKVGTAIKIADIYQDMSQKQLELEQIKIVRDVKKSFYTVLGLKESLRVMKIVKDDALKNLDNIMLMQEQGLVSEFDLVKATVRVKSLDPKIEQIKNGLTISKNALKIKLGMNLYEDLELLGEFSEKMEVDTNNYDYLVENNRLELKLLDNKIKILKENRQIAKSDYYPNIMAVGNYSFHSKNDDYGDTFEKNYGVHALNLGLSASISLYQGGETRAKVDKAAVEIKKAKHKKSKIQKQLQLEAEKYYNNIKEARKEIYLQKQIITQSQKALKIANVRYNNGLGTQLEVLDAQASLEKSKLGKIDATHALINAIINFEYATGQLKTNRGN